MDEETKNRVDIEDLAKPEEELSADEANNVTGGYSGGVNVAMGDGSVRFVKSTIDNTIGGALSSDGSTKSG